MTAVPEKYRDRPDYAYVEADPGLRNVLLIGDSISMQYTVGVRERLSVTANVLRAPDNCRTTRQTLENIDMYLGGVAWDVIHVNWGIHDITRMIDGVVSADGSPQVPYEEYRANVERLRQRLEETTARLIWAATTPVADNVPVRRNRDIETYNEAATEIMNRHSVTVNNLHRLVAAHHDALWRDGVHFSEHGARVLAEAVARTIRGVLRALR